MEKIQKRALNFVYCDFRLSYKGLRDRTGVPILYLDREDLHVWRVYDH